MVELFKAFLERAEVQGSKSTALAPLGWVVAIVASVCVSSMMTGIDWFQVGSFVLLCACLFVYGIAFFILLLRDRDALRSEKFVIQKLAIERSLVGDSLTGFVKADLTNIAAAEPLKIEVAPEDQAGGNR